MDNSGFNSCDLTTKAFESIFKHGEAFYPFKSLAAAKAKYGAGVHNSSRAEDPGVQYSQAYFCHRRPGKAAREFDLGGITVVCVIMQPFSLAVLRPCVQGCSLSAAHRA